MRAAPPGESGTAGLAIKRFLLLRRRPGLSRAGMLRYWQHTHAPLAMRFPAWYASTARYVQNHVAEQVEGAPFDFDGMVESWQRPAGGVGRSFAETAAYRDVVGPDERNFIDREESLLFFAAERVLQARAGAVKLLRFLVRAPGVSAAEFDERWRGSHARAAREFPDFWQQVRGHAQNLVVPGSLKVVGRPDAPPPFALDGVAELRFDSPQAMAAALASPGREAFDAAQRAYAAPVIAGIVVTEVPLYDGSTVPLA
jgi:hypothetical protein